MIQLQAQREAKPGIAFPPDSHWQQEFEAAFPYTETKDQVVGHRRRQSGHAAAAADGSAALRRRRIRQNGSWRCGPPSKRSKRESKSPCWSPRPCSPSSIIARSASGWPNPLQRARALAFLHEGPAARDALGMETGEVDIVVGTHRMVQKDVRFKDLGLLVIDEEQRFGVDAKGDAQAAAAGSRRADDERHADSRGRCTCRSWAFAISRT